MEKYYLQFENCRQNEKPPCSETCPFEFDILEFQSKTASGRINAAFKTFRNAVGFPKVVAELCPGYCTEKCARKDTDSAVQLNEMEKATLELAKRKKPNEYNLPPKKGKVGIIGAGLSGLGCLLRLTGRKYNVTIYEKSDSIGGELKEMPLRDAFIEDITTQLQFENYTLKLNTEVKSLEELESENFDAIYIATGTGGEDFGVLKEDNNARMLGDTAVFAGGRLTGKDTIYSLAEGLLMARTAEVFMMTGKLEPPVLVTETKAVIDEEKLVPTPAVAPAEGKTYTEEELKEESSRCLRCQCDRCRSYCDLTDFYKKWPLQMRDEIITAAKPSESMIHKTPAMHLINACTQCGQCDNLCPGNIELGQMIAYARRRLHAQGKTPKAFRQFWLRDMEFANGQFASISRNAPGCDSSKYAFFPGCHLGATDPEYVTRTYEWLLSKNESTGLLLRCCSVPAYWDGDEEYHTQLIAEVKEQWESLGKPILITACSTCAKHFAEFLPEIQQISLYQIMADWGFEPAVSSAEETFSIFDPCSAANDIITRESVRTLIEKAEIKAEDLECGTNHGCCGFGGQGDISEPKFAKMVADKRSQLSDNPYIVYCANCRNVFMDNGKPASHVLNLLFDIENKPVPGPSAYRNNRVALKEQLLEKIWGETVEIKRPEVSKKLILSDEIKEKIHSLRLLEEDIADIIDRSEKTKRRTRNPETGAYKCYGEIGYITCWVEYNAQDEGYEILDLYTHRMKIVVEAVWNGRKTDEFNM